MGNAEPPSSTPPARRRNGRLQACEPCRKRKVSCDHTFPACSRCRTQGKPDGCLYFPSKQIGRRLPGRRVDGIVGGTVAAGAARQCVTVETSRQPHHQYNVSHGTHSLPDSPQARGSNTESSPGYLGSTSFSAIYQETQNSLSLVQGATILSSLRTDKPGTSSVEREASTNLTPRALENALTILQRIPSEQAALTMFRQHDILGDSWWRLAGQHLVKALPRAFGRELRSRKPADLRAMAQLISDNTARLWAEDEPDFEKWNLSFCGHNMRWESLGILFVFWAYATLGEGSLRRPELPEDIALGAVTERNLTMVYQEAAWMCVEQCRGFAPTSLLVYLSYKLATLESMLSGDAAPTCWRNHAEAVATATYLGLHAMPHDNSEFPNASTESRRRIVSQVFIVDKACASFNGRPPLLSRKYLLVPPPLDLSEHVLSSDHATIMQEVSKLDQRGWNREGKIYPVTIVRARRALMVIKDEILELALGHPGVVSIETLLSLKERQLSLLADFPDALHYHPEDVRDSSIPGSVFYAKVLIKLESLQNLFFLARLLVQRGFDSHSDLVHVSYNMLTTALVIWKHMDRVAGTCGNFSWLVMAYAAPAGGILCNELLKPVLYPDPSAGVTRSGIVQQLSLLIGFFDWVSPGVPNVDLCMSCKVVIQHVLDQTLNELPVNVSNTDVANSGLDHGLESGPDMGGFFNFELLDTFQWMRPDTLSG